MFKWMVYIPLSYTRTLDDTPPVRLSGQWRSVPVSLSPRNTPAGHFLQSYHHTVNVSNIENTKLLAWFFICHLALVVTDWEDCGSGCPWSNRRDVLFYNDQ